MSDLKILEKDGYVELDGVSAAVRSGDLKIRELWEASARGDTTQCALILFEAGFDMEDEADPRDVQVEEVKNIIVITEPDDIGGDHYRIWVKVVR